MVSVLGGVGAVMGLVADAGSCGVGGGECTSGTGLTAEVGRCSVDREGSCARLSGGGNWKPCSIHHGCGARPALAIVGGGATAKLG